MRDGLVSHVEVHVEVAYCIMREVANKNFSTFRKLPEACRKVSGSRQAICGPGPVWLMLSLAISVSVPDIFHGGLIAKKLTYRKPAAHLPKLMFAYSSLCDYHISEKGQLAIRLTHHKYG